MGIKEKEKKISKLVTLDFYENDLTKLFMALIAAKRGNTNHDAVDDFNRLQQKLWPLIPDEDKKILAIMEKIMD